MLYVYLAQNEMAWRQKEIVRQAALRRILREAQADRLGWLDRQKSLLACRLGYLAAVLESNFQGISPPQARPCR